MKIVSEAGYKTINGKNRKVVTVQCENCNRTKIVRQDIPQLTNFCIKCNKTTHGLTATRLYSIFMNMKSRCYNPNNTKYKYYGKQSITVCKEWKQDFISFHKWALANGYSNELSIDRIDGTLGYSPDNCRWATKSQQAINRTMPVGKSNLRGVTTRHIAQVRANNKIVFSCETDTAIEAAFLRELYIAKNETEHIRNFPGIPAIHLKEIVSKIGHNWASLTELSHSATIEDINALLADMPLT